MINDKSNPEGASPGGLSHFNDEGAAHMVDVGAKAETERVAVASGVVRMMPETATVIGEGRAGKGDVLGIARIAGIMATKKTSEIIPLCHPLPITHVDVAFELHEDRVAIRAKVATHGKTGVEMEALTAVSAAALTIYDMTKAIDRGMVIERIQLESKTGGRSGLWVRGDA